MILYDFDYERPQTREQAAALLAQWGNEARLLAGGTDLLPNMRIEIAKPQLVISLGGITPEPPSRQADGSIRIDALTRLATLEGSELVRAALPMLAQAAHSVAGQQIRQMGSIGGNLCQETRCLYLNQKHDYQFVAPCYKRGGDCCYPFPTNKPELCWSVYMSDTAPALIALAAEAEIIGPAAGRRIAVADLFTGNGLAPLSLERGELIGALVVPPPPPRFGWGYHKSARRGGLEFGMAVMAVALRLGEDGSCAEARIVLGAVREGPVRAIAAEQALAGTTLDAAALAAAAAAAAQEVNPLPHHGFTKSYLRDNIRVHLRRTLAAAAARARGEG